LNLQSSYAYGGVVSDPIEGAQYFERPLLVLRSAAALTTAVGEIAKTFNVSPTAAQARLVALAAVPKADLLFLNEHAAQVQTAAAAEPGQWKNWWWVCVAGEILFLPFIFLMTGRWSPRKAREDAEAHERRVQEELAALQEA